MGAWSAYQSNSSVCYFCVSESLVLSCNFWAAVFIVCLYSALMHSDTEVNLRRGARSPLISLGL